jgi:hypothetical protein
MVMAKQIIGWDIVEVGQLDNSVSIWLSQPVLPIRVGGIANILVDI